LESERQRLAGLLKQAQEKNEGLTQALDETRRTVNAETEELAGVRKEFEDEVMRLTQAIAEKDDGVQNRDKRARNA